MASPSDALFTRNKPEESHADALQLYRGREFAITVNRAREII